MKLTKRELLARLERTLQPREFDCDDAQRQVENVFYTLTCNSESSQGSYCALRKGHKGFHEADGVGWGRRNAE